LDINILKMNRTTLHLLLLTFPFWVIAQNNTNVLLDSVEIIGVTALHGIGFSKNKIASKVQIANSQDFTRLQSTDCSDFLNMRFSAVHINDPNGNSLEPELQYRGFVASPLLGMSQGIAVYQDGVRMNELFGDIVNWEIIPRGAIASVELSSGSNPLFGLNALGGALSFQTKNGFANKGQTLSLNGGSFKRLSGDYSGGWQHGKSAFFVNLNHFQEDGWRQFSPSKSTQLFTKYSFLSEKSTWHVALSVSNSELRGNGPLPIELLNTERNGVFTHPDIIKNAIGLLNIQYIRQLSNHLKLNTNTYFKYKKTDTFNGDVGIYDNFNGFMVGQIEDSSRINYIIDQNGKRIKADDNTQTAMNNRTETLQNSMGTTVQLAFTKPLFGKDNNLMLGLNLDGGQAYFNSSTELAAFTNDRGTIGSNFYDSEAEVNVKTKVLSSSVYAMNVFSVNEKLTLNMAFAVGHSLIKLEDQLGDALNGTHNYLSINPSVGAVYQLPKGINVYAHVSQSMRNPTPVELTCADEDAPCRLPNAFLSDPPLKQAKARTYEIGISGGKKVTFEASVFRTNVFNDIYFISSGPARNSGYFTNIGTTRREGIELSLTKKKGHWQGQTSYTLTNATFQTAFTVNSPHHPNANEGEIKVEKGNFMPLIPRHIAKAGLDYSFKKGTIGVDAIYNTPQYLRGDEANLLSPLRAFTHINMRAEYRHNPHFTFFGRIQNITNNYYETFGLLGNPQEVAAFQNLSQPQFLTPVTPISFNLGVKIDL
jgi:iron complex outermembrane recepter protein